jgi:two-component system cell cycle sensor histidine kinase/response regulator CckA
VAQMLQNLVQNAVEAMAGRTGVIQIKAESRDLTKTENKLMIRVKQTPCLCLSITDQGKGMTLDIQKHLFEPFFTTKNPRKGAGLGLAMVYGVVATHQGDITFESEEGKGSTFRIYLPPVKAS